ncbi:hypothetical protein BWO91_18295 [Plantibacter flavus]|nr:hypothetical protein BWO91_18295 [Plantibacter flavus]
MAGTLAITTALGGVLSAPAAATTDLQAVGSFTEFKLSITDDGIVGTLDPAADNGLIATGSSAMFAWSLGSDGLTDGVASQTLPEGWVWDESSLIKLNNDSPTFTSRYVLEDGGRTLRATMSIPSGSLVTVDGLTATMNGFTTAPGTVYDATVVYEDGTGAREASGGTLTTVGEYRSDLTPVGGQSNALGQYDFGNGLEDAIPLSIGVQLTSLLEAGQRRPMEIDLPIDVTLTYDGPTAGGVELESDLAEIVSVDGKEITLRITSLPISDVAPTRLAIRPTLWYPKDDVPEKAADAIVIPYTLTGPDWTTNGGSTIVGAIGGQSSARLTQNLKDDEEGGWVLAPPTAGISAARYISGTPSYPPLNASRWTSVSNSLVSPDAELFSEGTVTPPTRAESGQTRSQGLTNLVTHQFWNPEEAQFVLDTPAVAFGVVRDSTLQQQPADRFLVQYTNGTDQQDPESNAWFDTPQEAGGPTAITGVRVQYLGESWQKDVIGRVADFKLSVRVPLEARAPVGSCITINHTWTADETGARGQRTSTCVELFTTNHSLAAGSASVVGGNSVDQIAQTSLVRPAGARLDAAPITFDAVRTEVRLDSAVTAFDVSRLDPAWRVVGVREADLGPDGLPGTRDDRAPAYVTLESTAPVVLDASSTSLKPVRIGTTVSVQRPVKPNAWTGGTNGTLSTLSTLSGIGDTALQASSRVNVVQVDTLSLSGAAGKPQIESDDTSIDFTTYWYNFTRSNYEGNVVFLDVLPYNGDARGSSFSGTATLQSLRLLGVEPATVQVTTADPRLIGDAPGDEVEWVDLAEDADLSSVTAVRVVYVGFNSTAAGGLRLDLSVEGQEAGDVYQNSADAYFGSNSVRLRTPNQTSEVVGSTVGGVVFDDRNGDGVQQADEPGLADVRLDLRPAGGDAIEQSSTASDGTFSIDGLVSSQEYEVVVDGTTLPASHLQTAGWQDRRDDVAGPFTVPMGSGRDDLVFGYQTVDSSIVLDKRATLPEGDLEVGSVIDYTFVATNSGQGTLSDVQLDDDLRGLSELAFDWPAESGVLAAGATVQATASYTVTQSDIDRGRLTNDATVAGTDALGSAVSDDDSITVDLVTGAAVKVSIVGSVRDEVAAGAAVDWTVTVENAGLPTLRDVEVRDGEQSIGSWDTLAPAAIEITTFETSLTQSDIDAGLVSRSVEVEGFHAADGSSVTDEDTAEVPLDVAGAVSIEVLLNGEDVVSAPGPEVTVGESIEWTYVVTNTGIRTLADLSVSDSFGSELAVIETLAPGESREITVDSDAVFAEQTVTAEVAGVEAGDRPMGPVRAEDVSWYEGVIDSSITVDERAILPDGDLVVGSVIEFELTATNTSAGTALTEVQVRDRFAGMGEPEVVWPGEPGTLQLGESAVATVEYTLTQADIDRGSLTTDAVASGVDLAGETVEDSDSVTIDLATGAAVTVSIVGSVRDEVAVGATVDWTVTVENAGLPTLRNVEVYNDEQTIGTWESLAPGSIEMSTFETTLTQNDIDAGVVSQVVSASGQHAADGAPVTDEDTAEVPLDVAGAVSIEVLLNGEDVVSAPGPEVTVGESIEWTYVVTNTGIRTLADLSVSDSFGSELAVIETLAPGESTDITVSADAVFAEQLVRAVVSGVEAGDRPVGPVRAEDVSWYQGVIDSVITLNERAILPDGDLVVGSVIEFELTATNTSAGTALTEVQVRDRFAGMGEPEVVWPGEPGTLQLGESAVATVEYTLTQADIDRGSLTTDAVASGVDLAGDTVEAGDSVTIDLATGAAVTVSIVGSVRDEVAVGATVDWTVTVENAGLPTLRNVEVHDDEQTIGTWESLAPGSIEVTTFETTITQSDIDAGFVSREVSASGAHAADGSRVSDDDLAEVQLPTAGEISVEVLLNGEIVEEAPGPEILAADGITWTYIVTNTGPRTLTDVVLDDGMEPRSALSVDGALAPGASVSVDLEERAELGAHHRIVTAAAEDGSGSFDDGVQPRSLVSASTESWYVGIVVPETPEPNTPAPVVSSGSTDGPLAKTGAEGAFLGGAAALALLGIALGFGLIVRRRQREEVGSDLTE